MNSDRQNLVGMDGCRGGWLAVGERDGRHFVELWETLGCLFEKPWDACSIDMPIGLKFGKERRECDQLARELLGAARSSVFFSPPRELLEARDYDQVRTHGMSLQTFYLLPKIRQLDHVMTPESQNFIREAHPELAFRIRKDDLAKKRSVEGQKQRQELLVEMGSPFQLSQWKCSFRRKEVALDDFLDAAILLEVSRAWLAGDKRRVGGTERDKKGLRMEICF